MKPEGRNWISFWYEVASERGENIIASLGRGVFLDVQTGQVRPCEYHDFSHIEHDGMTALNATFKKLGNRNENWTTLKRIKNYSLLSSARSLLSASKVTRKRNAVWQKFDRNLRAQLHDYGSIAFTQQETTAILKSCAERNLVPYHIAAIELDRCARQLLADANEETKWLFPVNMRTSIGEAAKVANQVSFIPLVLSGSTNGTTLKKQIREHFENDVHWGNWCLHHVGRIFGEKAVRVLSHSASQKSFWMGTISDLGTWTTDSSYQFLAEDEIWFCVPPGSANYPLGFTLLTVNGRLSLSLKVHPSIHAPEGWNYLALQHIRAKLVANILL